MEGIGSHLLCCCQLLPKPASVASGKRETLCKSGPLVFLILLISFLFNILTIPCVVDGQVFGVNGSLPWIPFSDSQVTLPWHPMMEYEIISILIM